MAIVVSVTVLQKPDGTTFSGTLPTILIGTANIQEVTAASAGQIAALPTAASVITVKYNHGNNVLTGSYVVTQAVTALATSINA
jgi:hypothetical protein